MGYARVLGIIDYLKPLGYKFGRMYIIAPAGLSVLLVRCVPLVHTQVNTSKNQLRKV
jgi:hypothetical protein